MDPFEPRGRLSRDQKRALVILLIIGVLIAVVAIGLASLAISIGVPFWIASIVALVIAAALGLFMFLNMA